MRRSVSSVCVDRARVGERAVIARAVLRHLAHGQHFGIGVLPFDLDVRIALVVFQPDVEVRLVALDQIRFEQQRFQLGVGDDPFQIGDLGDEALRLGGDPPRRGSTIGRGCAD